MFTIGYSDLGASYHHTADYYLNKSTAANLYGPFKIWSEAPGGGGCPNFLTGAGVYLQSVWAGYGGLRFRDDALEIKLPRKLPNTTALVLRGIHYAGSTLMLVIDAQEAKLSVLTMGPERLVLSVDNQEARPLLPGPATSSFPRSSIAAIFPAAQWEGSEGSQPDV